MRRSRERFKNGDARAVSTLRFVLYTAAHVMAPVMPFFAEDLYRSVKSKNDPESVHLSDWPEPLQIDDLIKYNTLSRPMAVFLAVAFGAAMETMPFYNPLEPLAF